MSLHIRLASVLCAALLTLGVGSSSEAACAPVKVESSELVPVTAGKLLETVRSSGAKVVLVNLWATWCVPCRKEFPDLLRLYRAYKDRGVKLLLVSGDFPEATGPAKEFLASLKVDFQSYIKSGADESFINGLDPAWSGALPATFVYDAKGERRHSFLGPVTYEELEKQVAALLEAKP